MELTVNGRGHVVEVDPQKPLLWVLREELGLAGTKYGCAIGLCGTCRVLLDGEVTSSCLLPTAAVDGRKIVTIEGLNDELATAIRYAWKQERVSQCGYCQPGQLISAYALLSNDPDPSDNDIDENMTALCRCGTYQRIRSAIRACAGPAKRSRVS
jgi:isoquinoline 1-oxidoreductase alpha subunit